MDICLEQSRLPVPQHCRFRPSAARVVVLLVPSKYCQFVSRRLLPQQAVINIAFPSRGARHKVDLERRWPAQEAARRGQRYFALAVGNEHDIRSTRRVHGIGTWTECENLLATAQHNVVGGIRLQSEIKTLVIERPKNLVSVGLSEIHLRRTRLYQRGWSRLPMSQRGRLASSHGARRQSK